jgi:hypothetical protein
MGAEAEYLLNDNHAAHARRAGADGKGREAKAVNRACKNGVHAPFVARGERFVEPLARS